ncbi:MAG: cell wall metabolism sensor histidine kinase WalK [Coriobacteriales bacterium]|nr:cell wall metabolism sensor histidine kinase WalK [Coriobacteriales bacterium]
MTFALKPPLIAGMILFLALYAVSTLERAPRLSQHPVHRVDYYFTLLVAALCFFLIAPVFLHFRYAWQAHLVFPILLLALSLHVLTTTVVRIRTRSLPETILWVKVFRTLPMSTPSGILIATSVTALTGFIIYRGILLFGESFLNVYATDSRFGDALGSFVALFLIPAFIVAVIAILCRDVVALTAEQKREADRRIKAERLKAELITNVTHDLRTPLTTIINYIDHIKAWASRTKPCATIWRCSIRSPNASNIS